MYVGMPNLAALNLEGTCVNDNGVIEYLSTQLVTILMYVSFMYVGMPNLAALNLEGTCVNDTGVIEYLSTQLVTILMICFFYVCRYAKPSSFKPGGYMC